MPRYYWAVGLAPSLAAQTRRKSGPATRFRRITIPIRSAGNEVRVLRQVSWFASTHWHFAGRPLSVPVAGTQPAVRRPRAAAAMMIVILLARNIDGNKTSPSGCLRQRIVAARPALRRCYPHRARNRRSPRADILGLQALPIPTCRPSPPRSPWAFRNPAEALLARWTKEQSPPALKHGPCCCTRRVAPLYPWSRRCRHPRNRR